MSDKSREKRLADYRELLESLEEMVLLQQESAEDDEEMRALIADAEAQLRLLAQSLNAEETIEPTPGLVKVLLPGMGLAGEGGGRDALHPRAYTGGEARAAHTDGAVILFPSAEAPRQCAPYEVLFDERVWYPCVITAVVPPAEAADRTTYRAWILGYNVEEVVLAEQLRPWGPEQEEARKNEIRSGAACQAIRPLTGRWASATIERLTLEGTVMVTFPRLATSSATPSTMTADGAAVEEAAAEETVELPLSHVFLGRKFYPVLRKRPQLTEEERQAKRLESARRKRERAEEAKQLKADKVAQDASDWQALMGDMMGGGKKKRRF